MEAFILLSLFIILSVVVIVSGGCNDLIYRWLRARESRKKWKN